MVKICSKQPKICVKSSNPNFNYKFEKADEPLDVDNKHKEKILSNENFYEYKKSNKKKVK